MSEQLYIAQMVPVAEEGQYLMNHEVLHMVHYVLLRTSLVYFRPIFITED